MKRFLFTTLPSNNLFLRDLASGEEQLLTGHEGPGTFSGGLFSPEGSTIYLSSNLGRDRTAFARIEIDPQGAPGAIQVVAERGDAELQSLAVTEDGALAALL